YQHEMIALAKHYRNVFIDMCWAWIINPKACTTFVGEFLVTAPANKLLTFGGDYVAIEATYGHAVIARRGLTRALVGLIEEQLLDERTALELVPLLMHGNANNLFHTNSDK